MDKNDFAKWIRDGKSNEVLFDARDGGYLIPPYFLAKTKGFMGWIYRLFGDERGWYMKSTEQIIKDRITLQSQQGKDEAPAHTARLKK